MAQTHQSIAFRSTRNYQEIKTCAAQIREFFSQREIPFDPTSAVGVLLADAEALADNFDVGQSGALLNRSLFNAAHLDRMADALLLLAGESNCNAYLDKLTSNSLNFLERSPSHAKDIYWEIELWATIKRNYANVRLVDPPDILLDTPHGSLAIACKKIYSMKNVPRQLSSAVKQLAPFNGVGIAAINIDDLVPAGSMLSSPTAAEMNRFIDAGNIRFLSSFQRLILKYFESDRLSAIAICTNLLAEITRDGTRFNNARQMTVWVWPNVPVAVTNRIKFLADVMGAQMEYEW